VTAETPAGLDLLEPVGEGNPEPALASLDVHLLGIRPVGREGKHLQLRLGDGRRAITGIAFRMGELAQSFRAGQRVDLIYRPQLNEWQGRTSLQLVVSAIRPARGLRTRRSGRSQRNKSDRQR
jgi:single-stranded-DNA-specific exonuclease